MLTLGLIGKPNVGKSTFFKAATLKDVEIADYPFTTIKPNVGIAHVRVKCPHVEIGRECRPRRGKCVQGVRFVPVELYDVAGLVKGAHRGRGLGNQFLDDARRARVLVMVVDASGQTDAEGNPGEGNPVEDVEVVEEEFDRWLAGIVEKILQKGGDVEELVRGLSGLEIGREEIERAMEKSFPSRENALDFARTLRKIAKPMIIAANKADRPTADHWIRELKKLPYPVIPTSAELELMLRKAAEAGYIRYIPGAGEFEVLKEMSEKQEEALEFARRFLRKYGSTGVQEVLDRAVFEIARFIPVFPVEDEHRWTDSSGNVLPDCFLVPEGTTARDLAYMVHTDLGEKFIRAVDGRTKKILGADYRLKAGDVIKIFSGR